MRVIASNTERERNRQWLDNNMSLFRHKAMMQLSRLNVNDIEDIISAAMIRFIRYPYYMESREKLVAACIRTAFLDYLKEHEEIPEQLIERRVIEDGFEEINFLLSLNSTLSRQEKQILSERYTQFENGTIPKSGVERSMSWKRRMKILTHLKKAGVL